ncbi:MAG: 3-phenylpropionate/trans-cinnamate dioxygenase ferredoxin reductase subunit [Cryomorphaceae bacterium]|jgi:3-phenylpropionate/trans-cinnamate dioxygenase ferredoxin reductase subunit
MKDQIVVIIGASHAAAEAVSTLRKKGWQGAIALVGDEPSLPYQRPPLSKAYYKGEVSAEKLLIKGEHVYEKAEVDLYLGRTAIRINREQKTVELDGGEIIGYSKLILATGTRARLLPIEGADLPQIHILRTLADVDKIKNLLPDNSKLLIVGAGYIGLEVAASAVKQGVSVTVLEAMDRVLARVTSPVISEFYQNVHAQQGVDIRLNARLHKFSENADGTHAVMADGEIINFDCAIVGIGVIPNIELAQEAGLACDNGVLVDEFTRTDDPDIYAVGDCSNHPSLIYDRRIRLESVPNAMDQAKTAASAICGDKQVYNQVPWFWSDQYDIKLQTVGLLTDHDEVVVRGNPKTRKFSAFYLKQNTLIAMDAINSPAEFMVSKKLVVAGCKPDKARLADSEISIKEFL